MPVWFLSLKGSYMSHHIFRSMRTAGHWILAMGALASASLASASLASASPASASPASASPASDAPASDAPRGSLVVAGGGRLTVEIIERFVELAGGKEARLVVIPTATSDKTLPKADAVAEQWRARGIENTVLLHTRDSRQADEDAFAAPLRDATAVWISGGLQSRIAAAYVGTNVQTELHALLKRGGVIGGTSAGAAIQSSVMIESGNPVPKITRGLGLLPGAIIDQHFLKRNRGNRLINAIGRHPDLVGLGIDESTAIVVRGSHAKVIGHSYVIVVTAAQGDQPLGFRSLHSGDEIDLSEFVPKEKRIK